MRYLDSSAGLVEHRFKPNLRVVGKKYGKLVPGITRALRELAGDAAREAARAVEAGQPITVAVEGTPITLAPAEILVEVSSPEGYAVAEEGGVLVALDTAVTPELKEEGLARELVRHIQDARKNAGFQIADRIAVSLAGGGDAVAAAVREWGDYLRAEVLADEVVLGEPAAGAHVETLEHEGQSIAVGVLRR